jgi:hypothetical protein
MGNNPAIRAELTQSEEMRLDYANSTIQDKIQQIQRRLEVLEKRMVKG